MKSDSRRGEELRRRGSPQRDGYTFMYPPPAFRSDSVVSENIAPSNVIVSEAYALRSVGPGA